MSASAGTFATSRTVGPSPAPGSPVWGAPVPGPDQSWDGGAEDGPDSTGDGRHSEDDRSG